MTVAVFLSGFTMATFAGAAVFFLKFWRASGDPFFRSFAIACGLLAVERVCALFIHETLEPVRTTLDGPGTWIYLFRLLAFGLIMIAVIRKNRGTHIPGGGD